MSMPEPHDTPAVTESSPNRSHLRKHEIAVISLVLLVLAFLFSPSAVENLLLGWLTYLVNVIPRATVDGPSVVVAALAAVGFATGLHWTMRWLYPQVSRQPSGEPHVWRFPMTIGCVLIVLLLFAAGTAMVGVTHQAVWLLTGRKTDKQTELMEEQPVSGAIAQMRFAAGQSQSRSYLKEIGLGMHNFHDTHNLLPPGGIMDQRGTLLHGWPIMIGPYVGFTSQGIDFSVPWNKPPNDRLYRCGIPFFIDPANGKAFDEDGYGLIHFAGNVHVMPILRVSGKRQEPHEMFNFSGTRAGSPGRDRPFRIADVRDGTSDTLLVGQVATKLKPWGHPANVRDPALGIHRSLDGFSGSAGAGGALFVMCDGSVRFLNNETDLKVMNALSTPAGNDDAPGPSDD